MSGAGGEMRRKELILSHYQARLRSGHRNYQILDWESEEAQFSRFAVLLEYLPLDGVSLLDVGSGLGDLYRFIQQAGLDVRYTGIDINPEMVEMARQQNPEVQFLCADMFEDKKVCTDSSFDIVYTSGIFNLDLGNNREFLKKALDEFYRISSRYIVFNLLSERSTGKESRYYYFSAGEVEQIIREYDFHEARIVEDYLLNDFTVICEK